MVDGLIKKDSVGSSHADPTQRPDKILNNYVLQFEMYLTINQGAETV